MPIFASAGFRTLSTIASVSISLKSMMLRCWIRWSCGSSFIASSTYCLAIGLRPACVQVMERAMFTLASAGIFPFCFSQATAASSPLRPYRISLPSGSTPIWIGWSNHASCGSFAAAASFCLKSAEYGRSSIFFEAGGSPSNTFEVKRICFMGSVSGAGFTASMAIPRFALRSSMTFFWLLIIPTPAGKNTFQKASASLMDPDMLALAAASRSLVSAGSLETRESISLLILQRPAR
mmetsp:Transcript_89676/g.279095  ORF Transcript_89676/g.279095 Transcript_89676/m.279095 type:complete len:236 (-) Transcript_89676:380-1087(-)